ncbi:MAG TPA: hypothetical protein VFE38_04480 [Edaphobacter sp.]|nr:hypothetical protein [Edaphobacter sp.]
MRQARQGYLDANPRQEHASILATLAAGTDVPVDLGKWLAGERDFRDFSRLLSVEENRTQPMDPA